MEKQDSTPQFYQRIAKRDQSKRSRANAIHVVLTDIEREKLDWLIERRGEHATLTGVVRELIMNARN